MIRGKYKKKLIQFKEYYLKTVVLVTALVIFFLYIFYETVFSYREPAVTILVVHNGDMSVDSLREELEKRLDVGYVEIEQMELGTNTQRALSTRFASGDIDLFIAEQSVFEYYAEKDVMEDLGSCLKKELYDKLNEKGIWVESSIQEETIDGTFVDTNMVKTTGVILDENILSELGGDIDTREKLLMGIVKSSGDDLFKLEAFEILTLG